jgi:hypothetical protein
MGMFDALFILLAIAFFAAGALLVRMCERL